MKKYNSNAERQQAYRVRSKNVTKDSVTVLDLNAVTKRNLHRRETMLHLINDPSVKNNQYADDIKISLLYNMGGMSAAW